MACPLRQSQVMTLFDAFIIYLACGAPFGVHRFISGRKHSGASVLDATAYALFWIFLTPRYLHTQIKRLLHREEISVTFGGALLANSESLRFSKDIDESAGSSRTYPGIYVLRESVDRYAGITELLTEADDPDHLSGRALFEISGHPSVEVAAACLARRNRLDLIRHHKESVAELVNLCISIASGSDDPGRVVGSFGELFNGFRDREALLELNNSFAEAKISRALVKEKEAPAWETTILLPQRKEKIALALKDLALMSRMPSDD